MDGGDELAAQQLASVAGILLAWLGANAASAGHSMQRLPFAVVALERVSPLGDGDELKTALRALLARTEVARTAARLACTSKAVHSAVSQSYQDLVDAAGAAQFAHAAAMVRIVVSVCSRLGRSPRDCRMLSLLCNEPATVVDWKTMADDVIEYMKNLPTTAMAGGPRGAATAGALGVLAAVAQATAMSRETGGDEAAKQMVSQLVEKIEDLVRDVSA